MKDIDNERRAITTKMTKQEIINWFFGGMGEEETEEFVREYKEERKKAHEAYIKIYSKKPSKETACMRYPNSKEEAWN